MRKRRTIRPAAEMVLLVGFVYGVLGIEATGGGITSDSLVLNGSFETLTRARGSGAEDLKPQSWRQSPQGGWEIDMTNSQRGNNSLKATTAWSWLSQEIPAKPETGYVLRAYVRSDISVPDKEDHYNTFLTLECLDKKGQMITREWGIVNAPSSWQLRGSTIFTPPDTRRISIKLAKRQGEGSVWFDEVRLVEIAPGSVINSGFEMLDNQEARFWNEDENGGWSVERDHPWEGEKSMRASVAPSWLSQEVPVKDNRCYLLSAYVRSDITISRNACLTLESLDKDDRVLETQWGVVNAASSWQLKENLIFTPLDTREIRIKLTKRQGEGSVWFDEVKLVEVPLSLVLNSGFEILDSLGRPRLWGVDSLGGWSAGTQAPQEGQRSMRATVTWSWLSQEILVKPKTYYTLVVYLRSDIAIPENTFLTLEYLDRDNKVFKRKWGVVSATSSWQIKEDLVLTSLETRKIRIKLAKRRGEGSVWFDQVELIKHRFYTRPWGDKPFYVSYFSIYAVLFLSFFLKVSFRK